jgi:hypothetical protein
MWYLGNKIVSETFWQHNTNEAADADLSYTLLKLLCSKSLLCWNRACVEIFVLRKDKLCMEKPVNTQKLVFKITQSSVAATQNFPTQARTQEFFECKRSKEVWSTVLQQKNHTQQLK